MFKFNCSNLPATLVEEGAELLYPSSSFEISSAAHITQQTQTPRMPTLNATHNNIESTFKTRANRAKNTIQNHEQRSKHNQKSLTFNAKKFFSTQRTPKSHKNKNKP